MTSALLDQPSPIPNMKLGKPFHPALLRTKDSLSPKAREEISKLIGRNPRQFIVEALLAWSVIFAAIRIASWVHFFPVSLAAVVLIATRQNVLGLLVHEQAHHLAFRSKKGELIANLLTAYPLLITVEDYAQVHLSHHAFYFTEKDPDYLRKQGEPWSLPLKRREFLKNILLDLTGVNTWKTFQGKKMKQSYIGKRKTAIPKWIRIVFLGTCSVLFTAMKVWKLFFFYWLLPLMTILQVIIRWGALCEHKYNLINPDVHESTPIIKLSWWEKMLVPNLNFTYHIYHHYFPGIPFSNLPKVHEIFQREKLVNELNVFRGYGMFLNYIFRPEGAEI